MDVHSVDFDPDDDDSLPEGWQVINEDPEPEADERKDVQAAVPEQSQELFPAADPQPERDADKDVIKWELPNFDQWILEKRCKVPFDKIRFDISGREGQARVLDPALAVERQKQLQKNRPVAPIEPFLWQEAAGGKFVPLTLQHTTKALMLERERLLGQQEIPDYLEYVRGTVLKTSTPLAIRQAIAGSDQNRQESSSAIRMSRFAEIFLEDKDVKSQFERCCAAIARTGYARPTTRVCAAFTSFGCTCNE